MSPETYEPDPDDGGTDDVSDPSSVDDAGSPSSDAGSGGSPADDEADASQDDHLSVPDSEIVTEPGDHAEAEEA